MTERELPLITYASLTVGQRFTDTQKVLSRDMVRGYGAALHDSALAALADAPLMSEVRDPSLLILFAITRQVLKHDGRLPAGGILARQDLQAFQALRLGETVTTRTHVADKYEKRGRRYVQLRCELIGEGRGAVGLVDSHVVWVQ